MVLVVVLLDLVDQLIGSAIACTAERKISISTLFRSGCVALFSGRVGFEPEVGAPRQPTGL